MPHFGFTSPRSWLSYRVGWLFGVGLTKVGREARFLIDRTKTASALERSAWLYRCVISFALVGAEFVAARLFFDSRLDHVLSLPLAVGVLLVLPRPHVRWPLLIARGICAGDCTCGAGEGARVVAEDLPGNNQVLG